ncbi:MAG: hypothetical protein HYT42_00240 [Candidatus Sungbacteria bacterium]|nr:hypothetical protein [Candidatus Sungbacteria bacterium]
MKSRVALIIFLSIFAVVVFVIVILPFVFNRRPEDGAGSQTETGDTGVFRSDDGGKTWQAKSWVEGRSGSISSIKVNRLIQDPADPAVLYLTTGGNGLWVSRRGQPRQSRRRVVPCRFSEKTRAAFKDRRRRPDFPRDLFYAGRALRHFRRLL